MDRIRPQNKVKNGLDKTTEQKGNMDCIRLQTKVKHEQDQTTE